MVNRFANLMEVLKNNPTDDTKKKKWKQKPHARNCWTYSLP